MRRDELQHGDGYISLRYAAVFGLSEDSRRGRTPFVNDSVSLSQASNSNNGATGSLSGFRRDVLFALSIIERWRSPPGPF